MTIKIKIFSSDSRFNLNNNMSHIKGVNSVGLRPGAYAALFSWDTSFLHISTDAYYNTGIDVGVKIRCDNKLLISV